MKTDTTIKTTLTVLALILTLPGVSGAASPAPQPDRVVFPTGVSATDAANIQAAVNLGGIVLLKATNAAGQPTAFNFGPPVRGLGKFVDIATDVWILGETVGSHTTTIEGGDIPFLGLGGHVRIEALTFKGPLSSAIIIIRSTGAEVVGNRISSVVPVLLVFGLTEGRGIKFLGNTNPITGKVVVADNVIEDMHADISDGIVFDAVAADVDITGNHIETVQSDGILVINSRGGRVRIADNFVAPGPGDPGSIGNGIAVINNPSVDTRGSSYQVTGNRVICDNPQADGISLLGFRITIEAPVVERNDVTMHDSLFGAITLYGDVSHARVSNNQIDGDGAFGLDLVAFFPGQSAVSNTFMGNNGGGFRAGISDLFLDAHTRNTVVVGSSGTVIDLGTGNQITGLSKIGHSAPIGPQIQKARSMSN